MERGIVEGGQRDNRGTRALALQDLASQESERRLAALPLADGCPCMEQRAACVRIGRIDREDAPEAFDGLPVQAEVAEGDSAVVMGFRIIGTQGQSTVIAF